MEVRFALVGDDKNTPKESIENTPIGEGIELVRVRHNGPGPLRLAREMHRSLIQFYFAAEGQARFLFHGGSYQLPLEAGKSLLFYNPLEALPLEIELAPESKMAFLFITVESLHRLFVSESDEIAFLNQENINTKFYTDRTLSPPLRVALSQMLNNLVLGSAAPVFLRAKVYEILALYFHREEGKDVEQCPFLDDEKNVEKIRLAKKILVQRSADPPTLAELAQEIGLNDYRLKEGFKNIYGKTVFQFLNDYRLDTARHLLDDGELKVNEVAYQIGYSNPSHFIAAFRKKFGVTPKKYLMHR